MIVKREHELEGLEHAAIAGVEREAEDPRDRRRHVDVPRGERVEEAASQSDALDRSDAIIFGCPTYMGGPSAQFKTFADATSKLWYEQRWKDKLAAGFTNSGSPAGEAGLQAGDRVVTLGNYELEDGMAVQVPEQAGEPDGRKAVKPAPEAKP